ncbi:hypothetical protein [Sporosarcina highlanderae]|uniref:Uncharacterized protein n=1 Tax=Sporosarcina highlanderae TaxID=3035916 RepID=A0ABT8JL86_9BACL|nr:hypothetical protein [Sporosarcina highlanderae]MDN4605905.1 hypothetical protein [Sporosarcina highlanderae]
MNKSEFINGIKSLNKQSSWQEIQDYLLFDMKKLAILDKSKLELKKDYFKDSQITLEYQDEKTEFINNWLRYKIATKPKLSLYTTSFDCDTTEVVKTVLFESLITEVDSLQYNGIRGFIINDEINLETDTMHSFATTFNSFLRDVLKYVEPYWVENYIKKYELTETEDVYRDIYFLENINRWYEEMSLKDKSIYKALEKFAEHSHTIGNFIMVPKGYNAGRYSRTGDYWDLTLIDLKKIIAQENCNLDYKWYAENYHLFNLEKYFKKNVSEYTIEENEPILLFENHSFQHKKPIGEEVKEFASNVTSLISDRGLSLLMKINPSLMDNKAVLSNLKERNYAR